MTNTEISWPHNVYYVVDVYVGKYYGNTFSKKDVLEKCSCNGSINIYVNDKLGMKIFKSMSKELFNFLKNNTKNMKIYVNICKYEINW